MIIKNHTIVHYLMLRKYEFLLKSVLVKAMFTLVTILTGNKCQSKH